MLLVLLTNKRGSLCGVLCQIYIKDQKYSGHLLWGYWTLNKLKKKKCIYCYELLFAITIFLCILVCILIMCAFTVNDNEVENF